MKRMESSATSPEMSSSDEKEGEPGNENGQKMLIRFVFVQHLCTTYMIGYRKAVEGGEYRNRLQIEPDYC